MRLRAGPGAWFRIELPAMVPPAQAPVAAPPAGPVAVDAVAVLVVDDEEELGNMIADVLGAAGHRVDVVTDGAQALSRMETRSYDVVLSDLRMPVMDGPTLYAETRARHPGQERRFVFLTGDTFTGSNAEFLERAGLPCLSKPFTLDEIERVVANVVRKGRED
jgi:DNA-binding response OmpR family regulator